MSQLLKLYKIKGNPNNPRIVKNDKFKKLVQSINDFPEMLEKRPIIVDENLMILGGNMRLKACQELGIKDVWVSIAKGWSDKQKEEFIIKDNNHSGEWDWDILANSWSTLQLQDWGMDVWRGAEDNNFFDVEEDEEEKTKEPKASDDNYSVFEMIMLHENKIFLLNVLNTIKKELKLKTTADALLHLAKNHKQ
tara:strand:+ start:9063 stop:9641 length:579 start_codon:yes stop_codon:yes gene_type:complete